MFCSPTQTNGINRNIRNIIIMGEKGAGKTSRLYTLSNNTTHKPQSGRNGSEEFQHLKWTSRDGTEYNLIDTPGDKTLADVKSKYGEIKIHGLLYLHKIEGRQRSDLFKLIWRDAQQGLKSNIKIATTHWDRPWQEPKTAKMIEHYETAENDFEILKEEIGKHTAGEAVKILLIHLDETKAQYERVIQLFFTCVGCGWDQALK